jgi:hypothetical protein
VTGVEVSRILTTRINSSKIEVRASLLTKLLVKNTIHQKSPKVEPPKQSSSVIVNNVTGEEAPNRAKSNSISLLNELTVYSHSQRRVCNLNYDMLPVIELPEDIITEDVDQEDEPDIYRTIAPTIEPPFSITN